MSRGKLLYIHDTFLPGQCWWISVALSMFMLVNAVHQALLLEPMSVLGASRYADCQREYVSVVRRINAAVNVGPFGGEAMVGDITDPYLAGLRFTVRPLELAMGEGWLWDKLVVGTTFMTDGRAPTRLQTSMTSTGPRSGTPSMSGWACPRSLWVAGHRASGSRF